MIHAKMKRHKNACSYEDGTSSNQHLEHKIMSIIILMLSSEIQIYFFRYFIADTILLNDDIS